MKRLLILFVLMAMFAAACGGGEEDAADGGDVTQATTATTESGGGDDGGSGDGGSGDGDGAGGSDGSEPDDDDFGDITGNPDLDTDDLPDIADDIDDIVSLGNCVAVGLMATPPTDYQCRVLDQPVGGLDGFTMFGPGNELNITVGSPSPLGAPCEILQACDDAEPIELSANFPDTMILDLFGTVTIWGTHESGAELVITKASALTEDELQLIMEVLDSVKPA